MEWNQELLQRLVNADDQRLKTAVESAALAAGAGRKQVGRLTSDMDSLRRVLSGLKPSDLSSIVSAVGEENLQKILSSVVEKDEK